MKEFIKKIYSQILICDYRNLILFNTLTVSLCFMFSTYKLALRRFGAGVVDLIHSIEYYFISFFNRSAENNVVATVKEMPNVKLEDLIPWNWDELLRKIKEMWPALFKKEVFLGFLADLGQKLYDFSFYAMLIVPAVALLFLAVRLIIKMPNDKIGEDSKPLRFLKKTFRAPYLAVREWVVSFIDFCRGHWIIKSIIIVWVFNLNIASVVVEFLAFYFYFASAFDIGNIPTQILKLLVDVIIMLRGLPLLAWIIIGARIFDLCRQGIGYKRLWHNEMKNRGVLNSLPIVNLVVAKMGGCKTWFITDAAISTELMFRDHVFEDLLKTDLMLPNFPWLAFEKIIEKCIKFGYLYNLASIEEWMKLKRERFMKNPSSEKLYGYSLDTYALEYDDKLTVKELFEILEQYAKLYFMYVVQSSWIVSNYAIRTDVFLIDSGKFPLWDEDLFRKDPKISEAYSRRSHILDFDILRLGKKVIDDNIYAGSFEFGVVNITEIGKERKNTLELNGVKRQDDETNQKNDFFNYSLKMIRHPGCVNNYCYTKIYSDEQRPESLGADARDLASVLEIMEVSETKLHMPGFLFGDLLHDIFFSKCKEFYYSIRHVRGDNTLFMYIFKNIFAVLNRHYVRIYNKFGYKALKISSEVNEMKKEYEYSLSIKKGLADRYRTDCFSGYFKPLAKKSKTGLFYYPEYSSSCATRKELEMQHSYFVMDLEENIFKPEVVKHGEQKKS